MTGHPAAAVACALLAALLFAVAAVTQQRSAAAVPEGQPLVSSLLRNPRWWAATIGDSGGYALQVVALSLGAVLLVQPILVSALIFALPLAARLDRRRIDTGSMVAAAALTIALASFLIIGKPTDADRIAPSGHWLLPGIVLLVLIALAVAGALASTTTPAARALLLGTAAGALYGLAVALTDSVMAGLREHGIGHLLTGWQFYALVAAGLLGVYLQQRAFQAGPLSASLPALTIAEPLVAVVFSLAVLGERLRAGPLGLGVCAIGVVVMLATTLFLSRSQAQAAPDPA
ncbi:DMT family transporter [Nocardia sp. NPDC057353]|uniref:DMT family transporter n=1 Tax=Nocardia sp. NPDC057353 TaxID=3346104 RepID=UPI003627B7DA